MASFLRLGAFLFTCLDARLPVSLRSFLYRFIDQDFGDGLSLYFLGALPFPDWVFTQGFHFLQRPTHKLVQVRNADFLGPRVPRVRMPVLSFQGNRVSAVGV